MSKKVSITTSKSLAFAAALVMLGTGLSGCSKDHEEVTAPERVEQAAELARANAPKAEPLPEPAADAAPAATDTAPAEGDAAPATDDSATPDDAAAAGEETALSADAGKTLYDTQCQACHAAGVLGAPKYGDKEAWAPRIAQGKDVLYEHSAKGFNQMPAQASGSVSEDQVHAAVDYMVAAAS